VSHQRSEAVGYRKDIRLVEIIVHALPISRLLAVSS